LAILGFTQVLLARKQHFAIARQRHRAALAALRDRDATPVEAALAEALDLAIDGYQLAAAERLETHLMRQPTDFLALKLAQALRFIGGDGDGMLALTSRILPAWRASDPYYGFALGCHAFALGENGHLKEAEATGRRAFEIEPADAWGVHAVAHVYETRGEPRAGIAWLERSRAMWKGCNVFANHMAWHLALCHVALGAHERALAIYDDEVRPAEHVDYRDTANAISLLWRLEQRGCDVGARWDELHDVAREKGGEASLCFASLHYLLACVARDDRAGASRIVRAIEALAKSGDGDQARVAATVGVDAAHALSSLGKPARQNFNSAAMAADLPRIGGSNAQRDVFLRTLMRQTTHVEATTKHELVA
jgi:tetratricopeptide (TPR) repeat protein